jgi:hypothetical protein
MDERSGTIRLVESAHDSDTRGLVATVSRKDVEQAMRSDEGQVDLLLDVERAGSGDDGGETQRIALGWEPQDLERVLKTTDGSEISLTFEEGELERLLDEDVEAHGIRKTLAVLTVAVGMAGAGAGSALASPVSDGALPGGAAKPAASTQATDQSSWSTSETAGVAAAGTILALTAAGFAVRSRRGPRVAT